MKKILLSMTMLYGSVHGAYAPLYLVFSQRNLAEMQRLLDGGADVDTFNTPTGVTTLYHAVKVRRSDIIALLLARGADPCKKTRKDS